MEAKAREFYHIHKVNAASQLFRVGSRLNWVHRHNNFFYDYYSKNHFVYNDGSEVRALCTTFSKFFSSNEDYKKCHSDKLLRVAGNTIHQLSMFIREVIFEEVRSEYFPQLPSRKSCIWVCEESAVEYWWEKIKSVNVPQKILKLRLTGFLHIADQRHLIADTICHDDYRALAFEYWSGSDGTKPIEQEILFEGIIEILEEIQNIEEFRKKRAV